jgi:LuxR family maltose regulon positive regulatory protein
LLLAEAQPDQALNLLIPLVERATVPQRWNHVLEMRLLQAQAYQMLQRLPEALARLSQVVHLAAPEGYIRHFVDGGASIAELLSRLREEARSRTLTGIPGGRSPVPGDAFACV